MEVPSSMPNFTPIGATCRPCGAKNLKIGLLSKLNTGRFALRAMLPVIMSLALWGRVQPSSSSRR